MRDDLPSAVERLLAWHVRGGREVPWRGDGDAYRIWVGEVMAQQTRLSVVRERWSRFLDRFPDVAALAAASRSEVLREWEGLGYYARARNLHDAVRRVEERHGGEVPSDPAELRSLPGVGPYTAGAVASLAFGVAEPAVDGNVRRVLSRVADLERPSAARLDAEARRVLEAAPGRPADVNQALMDLGAAVCTPRAPACGECPLETVCLAGRRGSAESRPAPRRRDALPHRDIAVGIVWNEGRVLVARRPEDVMLGGLWEFPGGKVEPHESPRATVRRELREEMEVEVEVGALHGRLDHAYSHFRITLHAFHARLVRGEPRPRAAAAWRWAAPGQLRELAFPAANRRLIERLGAGPPEA